MHEFTGRPIFICGNQRSGTRMVANVLNQHRKIVVTDETYVFDDLHRLITQGDKKTRNDSWATERARIAREILLETSAQYVRDAAPFASRFGNKTPGLEFKARKVFDIFPDALFIYCLRHPLKVLRSLRNMPWNKRSVEENWERYKQSVAIFESLGSSAFLVQIDRVQGIGDQQRIVAEMLDFVGEKPDERIQKSASKEWSPANTIKKPLDGLTDEERSIAVNDKEYARICDKYGYALNWA